MFIGIHSYSHGVIFDHVVILIFWTLFLKIRHTSNVYVFFSL